MLWHRGIVAQGGKRIGRCNASSYEQGSSPDSGTATRGNAWPRQRVESPDVRHPLYDTPIVPAAPISSLGCAICDPVIAAWCLAGAPAALGNRRTAAAA